MQTIIPKRNFFLGVGLLLSVMVLPVPAKADTVSTTDYVGWHLPLPAGEWGLSRGPCNAPTPFDHNCVYYEERCAMDFVPLSGTMEDMPVLAPQSGYVLFVGLRDDAGLTLLVQHPDGRVSGYMHLSAVVVGVDEAVTQGQILGYAGHTGVGSGNAHLHFFIQPNAVERECLPLVGLDTVNYVRWTVTSHNLGWEQITLVDPPQSLLDRMPPVSVTQPGVTVPMRLVLSPGLKRQVSIALSERLLSTVELRGMKGLLAQSHLASGAVVYKIPVQAAQVARDYATVLSPRLAGEIGFQRAFRLRYAVRAPADLAAAGGVLEAYPQYLSPSGYASVGTTPELCWSAPPNAGAGELEFRVWVVGPIEASSGWISQTCWPTPLLTAGTYFWKVIMRDEQGLLSRTNQRPYAFIAH